VDNAEYWHRIEDVFHAALSRQASDRAAFILSACGGDDALRDKVLELLTHAEDETILRAEFLQLRSLFMVPRLTIGTRLGRYEIVAHIGEGGMGEVYEARDLRLDRTVAIKVLRPWLSSHPQFRERLEREAKAISKLSHPHICTLHDIGHDGAIDYLVMEYMAGETLADRLAENGNGLGHEESVYYAMRLADALDYAHRRGIIHRDLKPANIFLAMSEESSDTPVPKLLDFGLATTSGSVARHVERADDGDGSRRPDSPRPVLGTFRYMAPEQRDGNEGSIRGDIFSLGAVLCEMVTGKFEQIDNVDLSQVPGPLVTIVARCLARNPDDRWLSMGQLRDALAHSVSNALPSVTVHRGAQSSPHPAAYRDLSFPTAYRDLGFRPIDIAVLATNELLVLVENESDGLALEAYGLTGDDSPRWDPHIVFLWSRALGVDHYGGLVIDPNGSAWVIDRTGASGYDRFGNVTCRVTVPLPINMEVAALAFAGDDLVSACQGAAVDSAASVTELGPGWMVRLTGDGELCWSCTIPNPPSYGFETESWSCAHVKPGQLFSSEDCVFAVYRDFRGHGFGVGYIVSLHDGTLRYMTDLGPIDDVAVAEGAFIVSGLGHGALQTVLLAEGAFSMSGLGYLGSQTVLLDEVTGQHRMRWASAGRLAVAGKHIRVIEQGASRGNRLGRLLPDRTVLRGDRLQGFYTDDLHVCADGTLLFVREGHLLMARDLLVDFDMPVPPPGRREGTIVCRLAVGQKHFFVTYEQQRGDQNTYGVVAGTALP
jgi:serine/threonine protein kinase